MIATPWIIAPANRRDARRRIIAFPYAGGNASTYWDWARQLPAEIDVCAVQLPGRGNRLHERPFTRIEPLLDVLVRELQPLFDRPVALFGHSFGAVLAYALACRMADVPGATVTHLFASAGRAPHTAGRLPLDYRQPEPALVEALRAMNGTPSEVLDNRELLALVLPCLRADLELLQHVEPCPPIPLAAPITAFGGLGDPNRDEQHLDRWADLTQSRFRLHLLPGDHFFVHSAQAQLIRLVADALAWTDEAIHQRRPSASVAD